MSEDRVGTGGQPSVRPDDGHSGRAFGVLPRRRVTRAFLAMGAVLLVLAVGILLGHSFRPTNPKSPAASADAQAGNLVGGSLAQPDSAPSLTPRKVGTSAAILPLAPRDANPAPATAIHIPRLKVSRSMVKLHVLGDRSLSVPKSFADVGWWSEGPRPAAAGAVIVGGHVSSKSGPGVFFRLKDMRKGDLVTVDRADGTTAVFQVRGMASYPRENYPDRIVYRTSGKPSIHLITCDGAFNTAIGHHEDNLVVFADLVATGPTKEKAT